jgi:hypothetical protein
MARGKVRYVDWRPSDWLAGTRGVLTMREVAVYDVVLNLIYDRGDSCPDDPGFIYGHFRAEGHRRREVQLVSLAIDRLVELGKLTRHFASDGSGWLTNGRADIELGKAQGRIESASKAGIASGAARRERAWMRSGYARDTRGMKSKSSDANDLERTTVRNHQPPISSSSDTESVATRASRPVAEGPPARAPATNHKPAFADELARLAAEHRARFMKDRSA